MTVGANEYTWPLQYDDDIGVFMEKNHSLGCADARFLGVRLCYEDWDDVRKGTDIKQYEVC